MACLNIGVFIDIIHTKYQFDNIRMIRWMICEITNRCCDSHIIGSILSSPFEYFKIEINDHRPLSSNP